MAILPQPWFGPEVPHPAYWMILLTHLAASGAWHTRYMLILTRTVRESARQLGRAREEMVARAYEGGKAINQATTYRIDEVIDPAETRRWIMAALKSLPPPAPRTEKKLRWIDAW